MSYFENPNKISLLHQSRIEYRSRENRTSAKIYYINNKRHRENGPAVINYKFIEGKNRIAEKWYYINDKCHRIDGPAGIDYEFIAGENRIIKKWYYINGKPCLIDGFGYNRLSRY